MKKIFALAMVVIMAFALCACGEKGGTPSSPAGPAENPFVGTWESTEVEYMGETLTGEDAAGFVFIIEEDGTGKCIIDGENEGALEWSSTGSSISISVEEVMEFKGSIEGGKLVFTEFMGESMKVVFSKK